MILDHDLLQVLGSTACLLLQFTCGDCGTLCTWARVNEHVQAVGGCVCNHERILSRVLATQEGWERYPKA